MRKWWRLADKARLYGWRDVSELTAPTVLIIQPTIKEKKESLAFKQKEKMKIHYFASLKESLKVANEEITVDANTSVAQLRNSLIKKHGKQHFPNNILCAVNQTIVTDNAILQPTDEVAFYPPVTGG